MSKINTPYFKEYRSQLGFTSQQNTKKFFSAKDISPTVDYNYIELLNVRLNEIVVKIDQLSSSTIKLNNLADFCKNNITDVYEILKTNKILPTLNNQGRRPEKVYFSWMRGYIISNYFLKALCQIFEVDIKSISSIGDDDLKNIETFKRSPKADLEINYKNGEKIRLEVQSGFQGINDIKQHKVNEAKTVFRDKKIPSIAIHFDLFNGQVAFIKLNNIEDNNINWITRQQMEGQTVFNIEQNYFVWKLTEQPPKYSEIKSILR